MHQGRSTEGACLPATASQRLWPKNLFLIVWLDGFLDPQTAPPAPYDLSHDFEGTPLLEERFSALAAAVVRYGYAIGWQHIVHHVPSLSIVPCSSPVVGCSLR